MVLSNIASDPHKSFSDSIEVAVSNHNPRTILFNLNVLDKIDQDKAFTIFKERFAAPANFTFVFTGNIDPNNDVVKNLICTYLGGLKSERGGAKFTDNNIRNPKGKVNNYFAKEMQIKKASNYIQYTASIPYNLSNDMVIRAIGDILTLRYTESIREKEGASYTIQASGSLGKIPVDEATLKIQFETDPVKQEKMKAIIYSEINKIIEKGPLVDDLQKVKENMLKKYTEDLTENGWWQNAVVTFYKDNINLIDDYKTTVEALTLEKIQTTLKTIVSQENVLDVVMKPVE
jgi:zinc protease